MKREMDTMNNLNQDCDKTGPPGKFFSICQ